MKNFIQQDIKELNRHMVSCKRKHPIIFIINSHLMDTAEKLSSHVGSLALFVILLITFLS